MFGIKKDITPASPADEFARRQQELDAQRAQLEILGRERAQLKADVGQATVAKDKAQGALARLMNDVSTFADSTDDDLPRAKAAYRTARDAESKAISSHDAHVDEHGDLGARSAELADVQRQLDFDKAVAQDRDDCKIMADATIAIIDAQQRMADRRRAIKGLSDFVMFPPGYALQSNLPGQAPAISAVRRVFRDHVLRGIAETYPDVLPDDLRAELTAKIAADAEKGAPRFFPCTAGWDLVPPRLQ